jgi:hypothetical protein
VLTNLAGSQPRARERRGARRHDLKWDADILNVSQVYSRCKRLKRLGFSTLNTSFNGRPAPGRG